MSGSRQEKVKNTRKLPRSRTVALVLSLAAIVSAIATYILITHSASAPSGMQTSIVYILIGFNALLLLALIAVVAHRAHGLWRALKQNSIGSRLQTRIITMFTVVAILPTILVSLFSAVFFNFGIQSWFNQQVKTALEESVAVAEAYLVEHKEGIRADTLAMANDLNRDLHGMASNVSALTQIVETQAALRNLTEAIVFQPNRTLARTRLSFSLAFERIPLEIISRANVGEIVVMTDDEDKVRALVKLDSFNDTYLLVGRLIDAKVINHMQNAQGAVNNYNSLRKQISGLQIQFSVVFIMMSLLLLLAAIWYGMVFASKIMIPITELITAAERVRGGDFSARVETRPLNDEIGTLGRAFNRMTGQLQSQRDELMEANRELDERRRFTEVVLAGVSAGVIALTPDQRISLYNRTAFHFLKTAGQESLKDSMLADLLPGAMELVEQARIKPDSVAAQQISITREGKTYTLNVKISVETCGEVIEGYIITFDDISELVAAQRSAAWADVARRVAHEIKNPLTPISLAAERLKKKYLPQITADAESYLKYIDTISKHAKDIGRMVEEFVSFARMPAPVFRQEDIISLLKKAVFSAQVARPDIAYEWVIKKTPLPLLCDEQQISQLLTNILKNAAEALENTPLPRIMLGVSGEGDKVIVEIRDNGSGVPADMLSAILQPYVTTRTKGTGLGLAIAKKTMEDHKGSILIANHPEGGALVTLIFTHLMHI